MKKRNFSINLPESMIQELDTLREADHRSRSNFVEYLVRLGLEKYKRAPKKQ